MTKSLKLGLLSAVVFSASAFGQFSINISIDELGNGRFTNTSGFNQPLAFGLANDPGPGGLNSALTYDLLNPPGLVSGDLLLLEPGSIGILSDILRFNASEVSPGGHTGSLVVYSDLGDGADSLADIGFPSALYPNNLSVFEIGPEGSNGFTYTPTAGQPGFVGGAAGPVTYTFVSDGSLAPTPEPSTVALVVSGFGLLGLARLRRKK